MKKGLTVIVFVVAIIIVGFNYDKLYAAFFNRFTKVMQNQTCVLDFEVIGDFSGQQFVNASEYIESDENNEAFIPIDFDVKNSGNCDIYIRAAISPIILDKDDELNKVYKLKKSSCEIQYCNSDGTNNLEDEYWEKSSDGYYYYKDFLKEGDYLKNKFVSGIKFKLQKEEAMDFNDKKKRIKIAVLVEARQNEFK